MEQLTKICWHLIAPLSTLDFSGEIDLTLAFGLVASCCSHPTACWRPASCWLGRGSMSIGDPSKSHYNGSGAWTKEHLLCEKIRCLDESIQWNVFSPSCRVGTKLVTHQHLSMGAFSDSHFHPCKCLILIWAIHSSLYLLIDNSLYLPINDLLYLHTN